MVAKMRSWLLKVQNQLPRLLIGYDIEITIPIFFIYNWAMFYGEGNTFLAS